MDRALGARYRGLSFISLAPVHGGPSVPTIARRSSAARGLRRIFWQRERSVASIRPGRCATMRKSERDGGSSMSFNRALALF